MIRVGIDQGVNGAVCIFDDANNTVEFHNTCGESDDAVQFAHMVHVLSHAMRGPRRIRVSIERLAVFAGKSRANAIFSMGRTQGITEAALQTLTALCVDAGVPIEVEWWAPSRWKRAMGLIKKDKNASKELAYFKAELLGVQLPKRMRHDCAEAFLIALL